MGTAISLSAKAGDAFFSTFCAPAGGILQAERRINNGKNSVFWLFD